MVGYGRVDPLVHTSSSSLIHSSTVPARPTTLGKTATKILVLIVVLLIAAMSLWTAFTVRDVATDPETQEVLDGWREETGG